MSDSAFETAYRASPLPAVGGPIIEVKHLEKRYGQTMVHQDLNLSVRRGEIVSIVGGSGSGKTTLLRQILGLERPSKGQVRVFGEDPASDIGSSVTMRNRSGMLFQRGALFSALSVFDNVAQPIREFGKIPADLLTDIVRLKLEMVGLSFRHATKLPAALSGGMVKRVGIARALALEPELLFLDEPTAGLDPTASEEFVTLIASLHRALGLTVVMVTHDLDTLMSLSTRVAVLADKRVLIAAPVEEVAGVDHPFIHDYFLGPRGCRALLSLPAERLAHLPEAVRKIMLAATTGEHEGSVQSVSMPMPMSVTRQRARSDDGVVSGVESRVADGTERAMDNGPDGGPESGAAAAAREH